MKGTIPPAPVAKKKPKRAYKEGPKPEGETKFVNKYQAEHDAIKQANTQEYPVCKECNETFLNEQSYKRHQSIKHSTIPKVYPCPYANCSIVFNDPGKLRRH